MTMYTFCINGLYRIVEADSEEGAIKEARIKEDDAYDLIVADSFDDRCFLPAVKNEIMFASERNVWYIEP